MNENYKQIIAYSICCNNCGYDDPKPLMKHLYESLSIAKQAHKFCGFSKKNNLIKKVVIKIIDDNLNL